MDQATSPAIVDDIVSRVGVGSPSSMRAELQGIAANAIASRLQGTGPSLDRRRIERDFLNAFAAFAGVWMPSAEGRYRITYSATAGLIEVAGVLRSLGLPVIAHEPHLQFVRRIFERHALRVTGTSDLDAALQELSLEGAEPAALFLTVPSNPVGSDKAISGPNLDRVIEACKSTNSLLVLDLTLASFQLQSAGRGRSEIYDALECSDVDYIAIEDAGKILPLDHLKSAIVFCSSRLRDQVGQVHDDVLDYVSPSIVSALTHVYEAMARRESCAYVEEVARRWAWVPTVFGGLSGVEVVEPAVRLNFAWIRVDSPRAADAVRSVAERFGLAVTGGEAFFADPRHGMSFLRVGLDGLEHYDGI